MGLPAVAALFRAFDGGGAFTSRSPANTTPEAPPVAPYQATVAAVGLVEASTENIARSTPVSGLCTRVYVQAGDRAIAGQKPFSLDDRHLQGEMRVRQRALAVIRAQLAKLLRSSRPEEVPPAKPE
jgi:HlyD family secretion protein